MQRWSHGLENATAGALVWSYQNPLSATAIIVVLLALLIIFGFLKRIRRTWTAMLAYWSRVVRATIWVNDTISVGTIGKARVKAFRFRRALNVYGHAIGAAVLWTLREAVHRADVRLTSHRTDADPGAWSYIAPPA